MNLDNQLPSQMSSGYKFSGNQMELLNNSQSANARAQDSGRKVISLEKLSPAVHNGKSILLDREERELVKKGEQVT